MEKPILIQNKLNPSQINGIIFTIENFDATEKKYRIGSPILFTGKENEGRLKVQNRKVFTPKMKLKQYISIKRIHRDLEKLGIREY